MKCNFSNMSRYTVDYFKCRYAYKTPSIDKARHMKSGTFDVQVQQKIKKCL